MWGWCCNCCLGKKERTAAKMQQLSKFNMKKCSGVNFQAGDAKPPKHPTHSDTHSNASRAACARVIPSSNSSICFPTDSANSSAIGFQENTFSELKWTIYPDNSHTKYPKLSVPKRTYTVLDEGTAKSPKRQDYTIIKSYEGETRERRQNAFTSEKQDGNVVRKINLPDICCKPNQSRINQQLREAFDKESRALEIAKRERITKMVAARNSTRSRQTSSSVITSASSQVRTLCTDRKG